MFGRSPSDQAHSEIVLFDEIAAAIRESLKGGRLSIGAMELWLASIALVPRLILITGDSRVSQ